MNIEQKQIIQEAVKQILKAVGDDPNRPGLLETPRRVADMYEEVFSSLENPEFTEYKVFDTTNDEGMILMKDIEFYSMCEHHLLPFFGKVHVAYVPNNKKVVGLSKIPRLVAHAAKRPNLQENMTASIANTLTDAINPKGVAVMIEAEHMCVAMRGIKSSHNTTITSFYTGIFKSDKELKQEFLASVR